MSRRNLLRWRRRNVTSPGSTSGRFREKGLFTIEGSYCRLQVFAGATAEDRKKVLFYTHFVLVTYRGVIDLVLSRTHANVLIGLRFSLAEFLPFFKYCYLRVKSTSDLHPEGTYTYMTASLCSRSYLFVYTRVSATPCN